MACIDQGKPDPAFVGTTYRLDDLELIREALASQQAVVVQDLEDGPAHLAVGA